MSAPSISSTLSIFFSQAEARGDIVVREHPRLDLGLYISNYTGRTRFDRLMHIGQHSVVLAVDALKAAVAEAKLGRDLQRYNRAVDLLAKLSPDEPEATLDQSWVDSIVRGNKETLKSLERYLASYKNNLVKESIRIGHEDLGNFYERCGNLVAAQDAFARMRPDVSTRKHIVEVGKHLIRVAMQRKEWASALNSSNKILSTALNNDDEGAHQSYCRVVNGLCHMASGSYLEAANQFLRISPFDPAVFSDEIKDLLSPNDVGIYGGLLALAFLDRAALQSRLLGNSQFRSLLGSEPHIRKAISLFVSGRYSACLEILESHRPDFFLDMYLARHVSVIFQSIRCKLIVQYFVPFSSVSIDSLQAYFGRPDHDIVAELKAMIGCGKLKARIDSREKLLVAYQADQRSALQAGAMEMANLYLEEARERLWRLNIYRVGLEVKAASSGRGD